MNSTPQVIGRLIGKLIALFAMVFFFSVMWNDVMTDVFALPRITFWDAFILHGLVYNIAWTTRLVLGERQGSESVHP